MKEFLKVFEIVYISMLSILLLILDGFALFRGIGEWTGPLKWTWGMALFGSSWIVTHFLIGFYFGNKYADRKKVL